MRRSLINQETPVIRLSGVMHNVINKIRNAHSPVSCVSVSTGLVPKLLFIAANTKREKGNRHSKNNIGFTKNDICLLVILFKR